MGKDKFITVMVDGKPQSGRYLITKYDPYESTKKVEVIKIVAGLAEACWTVNDYKMDQHPDDKVVYRYIDLMPDVPIGARPDRIPKNKFKLIWRIKDDSNGTKGDWKILIVHRAKNSFNIEVTIKARFNSETETLINVEWIRKLLAKSNYNLDEYEVVYMRDHLDIKSNLVSNLLNN